MLAFLAEHNRVSEDASQNVASMALGYAAHILTDVYWRADVLLPFRAPFEERLCRKEMPVAELRALYYSECDKVDIELYDRQPWRPEVWALLRAAQAQDLHGLLSADEIAGWRDRVLTWFDAHRHRADYTLQHLSYDRALSFIDSAAARVHERLATLSKPRLTGEPCASGAQHA
jgi:hypothetical protein